MNELIKIRKSPRTGNPIVNARDLHEFLEVGQDFSNWFKRKINKYGFIENVDYAKILFDINGKRIYVAKNSESDSQLLERIHRIEYALTLDCAKELSMVQNNEKGRQARQYFIEKEKEFWVLKDKLETASELNYSLGEVAKMLNLSDYCGNIGRNQFCRILQKNRILTKKNRPLMKYVKRGYFLDVYPTRATENGLKWLNQMFVVQGTGEVTELRKMVEEMKRKEAIMEENQQLLIFGMKTVAETFLAAKGGRKAEEQNRVAIEHLKSFIGNCENRQKALKQ